MHVNILRSHAKSDAKRKLRKGQNAEAQICIMLAYMYVQGGMTTVDRNKMPHTLVGVGG